MRAEQVFIVSEGAIENPWFLSFLGGCGSPGRENRAFPSPLMHGERPRQRCPQQWQEPRVSRLTNSNRSGLTGTLVTFLSVSMAPSLSRLFPLPFRVQREARRAATQSYLHQPHRPAGAAARGIFHRVEHSETLLFPRTRSEAAGGPLLVSRQQQPPIAGSRTVLALTNVIADAGQELTNRNQAYFYGSAGRRPGQKVKTITSVHCGAFTLVLCTKILSKFIYIIIQIR